MRNEEEIKSDIENVNKCLNPLSLYSTKDLVDELISRGNVEWHQIDHGDQFSYQVCYDTIDFTSHMPKTTLILVDMEMMKNEKTSMRLLRCRY